MPDETPREYTNDEVADMFIDQLLMMAWYWNRQEGSTYNKLIGLLHSVCVIIDGESSLPAFILAPRPHEEDMGYHIAEGENYYPLSTDLPNDIGGSLHERLIARQKKSVQDDNA